MSQPPGSLYDANDYYLDNERGSRFSPLLDGVLNLLEWARVATVLFALRGRRGKALDVGGGNGRFLATLRRFGFQVVGTTASKISAGAARRQGVTLHVTEDLDAVAAEGPFDLVTYWHVYEHLADPPRHWRRWRQLMAPGGYLVIEVPNIESLGARLNYKAWLGSDDVHHINHQAPAVLRDILRQAGFGVVRTDQFSLKFSVVYLWSALLGRLFPASYDFERLIDLLKKPGTTLVRRPLATLNAVLALLYLLPIIAILIPIGLLTNRGEVVRYFARPLASPST